MGLVEAPVAGDAEVLTKADSEGVVAVHMHELPDEKGLFLEGKLLHLLNPQRAPPIVQASFGNADACLTHNQGFYQVGEDYRFVCYLGLEHDFPRAQEVEALTEADAYRVLRQVHKFLGQSSSSEMLLHLRGTPQAQLARASGSLAACLNRNKGLNRAEEGGCTSVHYYLDPASLTVSSPALLLIPPPGSRSFPVTISGVIVVRRRVNW